MPTQGPYLRVFECPEENMWLCEKGVNGLRIRVGQKVAGLTDKNGAISLHEFDGVQTLYINDVRIGEFPFGSRLRGGVIVMQSIHGKLKLIATSKSASSTDSDSTRHLPF